MEWSSSCHGGDAFGSFGPLLAGGPSLFGGSGRMATSIFDDDDDDDFVKQERGGLQNRPGDGKGP